MDTRIPALARNLLDYSLSLQRGEKLLVEGETGCEELVRGLTAEAYARGAQPFFEIMAYPPPRPPPPGNEGAAESRSS